MDTTKENIISLLHGWQEEQRLVKCGVTLGPDRVSQVVGKVDVVEDFRLHISATKLKNVAAGDHYWIEIPLMRVERYVYVEGHEAPAEYRADIAELRYKGMIGIELRNGLKFALLALRTEEERLEMSRAD